jgi:hypothetical protein
VVRRRLPEVPPPLSQSAAEAVEDMPFAPPAWQRVLYRARRTTHLDD